jgi:hypothetical protein
MDKWPVIIFLDFSLKTRVIIIAFYIFFNIILYVLFRKKDINKKLFHKILSMINIFFELFIIVIILYQFHVLFIIFAPFIIMFITLFGYGINAELSDEDKALLVSRNLILSTNFNSEFVDFIYFPGYYVIESWKNKK